MTLAALAADRFEPRAASSYPARQTVEGLTVAADAFDRPEEVKEAFGKTKLSQYGILPVLVVMANDTDRVLHLEGMKVELSTADGRKFSHVTADDVYRSGNIKRPDIGGRPSPIPPIPGIPRGRAPKQSWEVAAREFAVPVLAGKAAAHGFFYFRVGKGGNPSAGAKLVISGIRDARSGQELLYFDLDLAKPSR